MSVQDAVETFGVKMLESVLPVLYKLSRIHMGRGKKVRITVQQTFNLVEKLIPLCFTTFFCSILNAVAGFGDPLVSGEY